MQPITDTQLASTSAPITSATGGVFTVANGYSAAGSQLQLPLPGSNRLNGTAFRVRISGSIQLGAGTYTANVAPILYAGVSGFTAAAANAIYSATAQPITVATSIPSSVQPVDWSAEVYLKGSSLSGKIIGYGVTVTNNSVTGYNLNIPGSNFTLLQNANLPTLVNYATEPPLAFAAGVGLSAPGNTVASLTEFTIEA